MNFTPGVMKSPNHCEIRIYSSSCTHWGWDMLTSILIHEFGHALMKIDNVACEGGEAEEHAANRLGFDNTPNELIPVQYWQHREFCMRSYSNAGYSEHQLVSELKGRQVPLESTAQSALSSGS